MMNSTDDAFKQPFHFLDIDIFICYQIYQSWSSRKPLKLASIKMTLDLKMILHHCC